MDLVYSGVCNFEKWDHKIDHGIKVVMTLSEFFLTRYFFS